jgi:hypothetical protein
MNLIKNWEWVQVFGDYWDRRRSCSSCFQLGRWISFRPFIWYSLSWLISFRTDSLSLIKNYSVVIFDISPLKFGLVDCVWDKIIICKIYETNEFSCCYLNSVESLTKNNYIIHMHIFTTSVHWNILRNLRKHQIFSSISDLLSPSADRVLYPARLWYLSVDFYSESSGLNWTVKFSGLVLWKSATNPGTAQDAVSRESQGTYFGLLRSDSKAKRLMWGRRNSRASPRCAVNVTFWVCRRTCFHTHLYTIQNHVKSCLYSQMSLNRSHFRPPFLTHSVLQYSDDLTNPKTSHFLFLCAEPERSPPLWKVTVNHGIVEWSALFQVKLPPNSPSTKENQKKWSFE